METLKMNNLRQLHNEIRKCDLCGLCKNNPEDTTPVPGFGPSDAKIMLIGECPGLTEIYDNEPFVGRSGKLLRKTLADFNLKPEKCYITNVAKCVSRKGNKNVPLSKVDQKFCSELWLKREIELVQPKVIMTLGMVPLSSILSLYKGQNLIDYATHTSKLSDIVGMSAMSEVSRLIKRDNGHTRLMPNFHPAFILRGNKDYFECFKRQIRLMSEKVN